MCLFNADVSTYIYLFIIETLSQTMSGLGFADEEKKRINNETLILDYIYNKLYIINI